MGLQKPSMQGGDLRLPTAADVQRAIAARRGRRTSLFPRDLTAAAAGPQTQTNDAHAASELQLPPGADVGRWLAALVARDGPETIAQALFASVKGDDLRRMVKIMCDSTWGPEPLNENGDTFEATPTPITTGFGDGEFDTHYGSDGFEFPLAISYSRNGVLTTPPLQPFVYKKCWHCEPDRGRSSDSCESMKLLESLSFDMEAQVERVADGDEELEPDPDVRRAARYFMYRKWVANKFDNIPLGKGNRVRIPPCVIECIRDNFREPGCTCPKGGALANCKDHGYTGHREAPQAS